MRQRQAISSNQWISRFPTQLLPQKLYDCLEAVGRSNLVEVLPHDRCITNCLEANHHCMLDVLRVIDAQISTDADL